MMKLIFVTAALCFAALGAQAQGGPCAKDRETFCKDVPHGGGAMMKCMHDNADKLSAECKAHVETMKEHMKEAREACHADVEAHCADVKPGKGAIIKCLKKNHDKLSEACQNEMKQAKEMRRKMKK